jgi:hypothetical protein
MLDRPERGAITLSPGLDRRNLSLNGFVAYRRVKDLWCVLSGAAGSRIASDACWWRLPCQMRPVERHRHSDAVAARRAGARENDFAHQTRLLLRDDLRDETAEREAQQIDFARTESAYERDGVPSHLLDRFGGRTSGSADPTIVEHNNVVLHRQAIHDPRIPNRPIPPSDDGGTPRGTPPFLPISRNTNFVPFTSTDFVVVFSKVMLTAFLSIIREVG